MTMRYRCLNPTKPHIFNGYKQGLVRQLPLKIQADFPAILTHKLGISKEFAQLMRPLFQHGNGPHRLSKILRILHTERYDELQLQYYTTLKANKMNPTLYLYFSKSSNNDSNNTKKDKNDKNDKKNRKQQNDTKQQYKEFSGFKDKNGYNGYVITSNYLSYIYSSYIEELREFMDQHTSLLDGIILKGNHSFKIIKHMGKINGISTFLCLYTLVNEYEEIRLQVLAPTKSLSHLKPAFNNMMESYRRLGMKLPQVFYTDNVNGDRAFLEEVIPSLLAGVQHVSPTQAELVAQNDLFAALPVISIPPHANVQLIDSDSAGIVKTNEVCQKIIEDRMNTGYIYIGLDCEWVSAKSNGFYSMTRSASAPAPVALVQIRHNLDIYLIRVHRFTASTFPENLAVILRDKKIIKVGKRISNDLKQFRKTFGIACAGELELGTHCKDKDLIEDRRIGLDKICGYVLKNRLPKPEAIRTSNWEVDTLSEEQKEYAALDAWVSLEIYLETKNLPTVNKAVNQKTRIDTFVNVHAPTSNKLVPSAYGYVCDSNQYLSPVLSEPNLRSQITTDTIIVKVVKIIILGLVLDSYSSRTTLESFGETPFYIAVNGQYLHTASESIRLNPPANTTSNPALSNIPDAHSPNNATIPSRIMKDAFHVMDMIKINLRHGMAKDFARRFRDCLFVVDVNEKRKVEAYLAQPQGFWLILILFW